MLSFKRTLELLLKTNKREPTMKTKTKAVIQRKINALIRKLSDEGHSNADIADAGHLSRNHVGTVISWHHHRKACGRLCRAINRNGQKGKKVTSNLKSVTFLFA